MLELKPSQASKREASCRRWISNAELFIDELIHRGAGAATREDNRDTHARTENEFSDEETR